jgi:hypothetical protein
MQQTVLSKPKLYHSYQNILQCYDTIIASFISSKGQPYHWLFSEHWGFFYYDSEHFYYRQHYSRYPLWDALRKIYHVRKTLFNSIPLETLLEEKFANSGDHLFVIADEFDLPWTPEYQNIHHPHYFLISDYDREGQRVYINDWWPALFQNWLDLSMLSASYEEMGQHAFILSEPSFQYSDQFLLEQMELAYGQMAGWEEGTLSAGIYGIKRFRQDIIQMGDQVMAYIDRWFYMVKLTIEAKYLFLEYTIFLQQEHKCVIPDVFMRLLEQTINAWFSFRNTMMSAKIRNRLQPDKLADRLDKVIQLETECVKQWGEIVSQTRASLHIYESEPNWKEGE